MPFTVADVEKHIKDLTPEQKAQWVNVANSALKKCEDEGGSNCDATAITQANGVVSNSSDDKDKDKTFGMKDVEIFATGVWHNDRYTTDDLDEMVKSFEVKGFRSPLKLGHNNRQEQDGQPAIGWVASIRRVGEKLLADFTDVPAKVFEAIKRKSFRQVSCEIIWNFKKDMPRVLRAVALLGADIPEVKGLKPLDLADALLSEDGNADDMRVYNMDVVELQAPGELPDAAFAIILPDGERKLPHHTAEVKSPTENNTVDKTLLRNALTRLPQTDMTTEQKAKALSHLEAHAKALDIGEAGKEMSDLIKSADQLIKEEEKQMSDDKAKDEKIAKLEEDKKALETTVTELNDENKGVVTKLAEREAEVKASTITALIVKQKKEGKLVPAMESAAIALLTSIDETKTLEFTTDGKKEEITQFDLAVKFFEAIPKMISLGEKADIGEKVEAFVGGESGGDAGEEVDKRVKAYMAKHDDVKYDDALIKVLAADPELDKAYNA